MSTLNALLSACQAEQAPLLTATRERVAQWDSWLQPLSGSSPVGEDPGYDDDFQQMREEVNKLSGADTELICRLAEKQLTTTAKDIRVATYYCWAKLHREGERGLAEGLELLAGLIERFGAQLHPQRDRSRKAALEWLAGSRMTDSLSLYPEVVREEAMRTTGALLLIAGLTENEPDETRPELNALYGALESRLQKAGAWMRWYRKRQYQRNSVVCQSQRCPGHRAYHVRSGFAGPGPHPHRIPARAARWLAASTPSDEESASRHPAGHPGPGCAGAYTHRAAKSGSARVTQTPLMDQLLAGLIAVDPARAAVLCG
jgi:type VI secretion system protein VasJ